MSDAIVPPRSPSLDQLFTGAIQNALEAVNTSMPGRVERYDAEKQLVDVQPMIQELVVDEEGELVPMSYSVIPGVPLVFPGGGGYRKTFPIQKGDYVLLVFSKHSINEWKSSGGEVDPGDTRRFHISDAIAIPGLHANNGPWTGAATDAATDGKDGGPQVVYRSSKIEIGGDAASPATESAVLGDTRKNAEDTHLQNVGTALQTASSLLSTVGTAVSTAAAAMTAAPLTPVGTILTTLATALTAVGVQLGTASSAFSTFKSQQASTLSGIVKLK